MPRKPRHLRIGIFGDAAAETVQRPLEGMLQACKRNRRLSICDFRLAPATEFSDEYPPPWTDLVDGLLVSMGVVALEEGKGMDWFFRWTGRGGVPIVSIMADLIHPRLPTVRVDPSSIARLAAAHLVQCGCRRFMHVGFSESMGSRHRAEAFGAALKRRGFTISEYDFRRRPVSSREDASLEGLGMGLDMAHAMKYLAPLLKPRKGSGGGPVGVLALGDYFARTVWNVCHELQLDVPGQVAIVGMNDTPIAFASRPTITSIHYPGEEVGIRATELLVELIDGKRRCPRRPIGVKATNLTVRESTGGPAGEGNDLRRALEMIRRRAGTGLHVAEIAEAMCVSRSWLKWAFRKHLGRSPLAEINRVRLARAHALLQLTELPIGQVSKALGFAYPSGFTAFFEKHTSLAPGEFRRLSRRRSTG